MRMIEQLVNVLSNIIFQKETGNYQEAIHSIDNAFYNLLGLKYDFLNALSAKSIVKLLSISVTNTELCMKCIVAARLLKERTEVTEKNEPDNSGLTYKYQKALVLYLEGILSNKNEDVSFTGYYADVLEIAERLKEDIPPEVLFKLFKFHILAGDYARAEDVLLRLRNINYPDIEAEGQKFYHYLESLSDPELEKGNFSRKDILKGKAGFTGTST